MLNDYWNKYNNNIPFKSKRSSNYGINYRKETGHTDERFSIWSIYNRINKSMRLQSDPTVIYSITKGQYQVKQTSSKEDLRTPSKFNTYRNRGLPPTPITNPGYKAIYVQSRKNKLYICCKW